VAACKGLGQENGKNRCYTGYHPGTSSLIFDQFDSM